MEMENTLKHIPRRRLTVKPIPTEIGLSNTQKKKKKTGEGSQISRAAASAHGLFLLFELRFRPERP